MKESIQRLLAQRPLLKAKEIAKELGLLKKDVNAFLHGQRDRYCVDESYRWALIHGEEIDLTLPDRWMNAEDFESLLLGAGEMLGAPQCAVNFIVPRDCKLMIDCTARLLSLMNQLALSGKSVVLDFTVSDPTKNYLDRAGFFDHLHERVTVLPSRPVLSAASRFQGQSNTLVEFGCVDPRTDNEDLVEELTEKFVQQASSSYRVAAFTVFSELVGNVREHSNSPLLGFAGLQKYTGKRSHIQTVVSDCGMGIADTLRPALRTHYPALFRQYGEKTLESDAGLVIAAMSSGNISRFGGARGLGFKSSREQAAKFHANFSVRQDRFSIRFEYRNGELVQAMPRLNLSPLKGTHICFDFFID